jgi:hypothetical protein
MTTTGTVQQLLFDHEGIILALLVASGIREGRWTLGITYELTAQPVILNDGRTRSVGAVVGFRNLVLHRIADGEVVMDGVAVVDAAQANPVPEAWPTAQLSS